MCRCGWCGCGGEVGAGVCRGAGVEVSVVRVCRRGGCGGERGAEVSVVRVCRRGGCGGERGVEVSVVRVWR